MGQQAMLVIGDRSKDKEVSVSCQRQVHLEGELVTGNDGSPERIMRISPKSSPGHLLVHDFGRLTTVKNLWTVKAKRLRQSTCKSKQSP